MAKKQLRAGDPLLLVPEAPQPIQGDVHRRVNAANVRVAHSMVNNDSLTALNDLMVAASRLGKITAHDGRDG